MISEDTNILIVRVPYRLPYFTSSRMADADLPPFRHAGKHCVPVDPRMNECGGEMD